MQYLQGPQDQLEAVPFQVHSCYWAVTVLPVSVSFELASI